MYCFTAQPCCVTLSPTHKPTGMLGVPGPQVLLPLLKSDLYEVLLHTLQGTLASHPPLWLQGSSAVTVVMASAGYPGAYEKGVQITGAHHC